ncbi:Methyltransferase type 11 [Mesorhizobium plurifarium]|uniref:Methyltransferase type 11 n=1 Tax=Mesorhizobium plurifarium TaxID=69974 RepID=A0A090GGH8_MESPL|nr:Methyltransferase type 11 [Mesorhizobium plurifarium]
MKTPEREPALDQAARKRAEISHLKCDASRLALFYGEWASSYNRDVSGEKYYGPITVAELAGVVQAAYLASAREAITVLDAGCGTGLVGVQLARLGFELIDGFDLTEEMAGKARRTGVYRNILVDADLNVTLSEYPDATYDITVCCGVFGLGQVRPQALRELARVTRANGFVIASTSRRYLEATSFEDEVRRLQQEGVVVPAQCLSDGRYIADEPAHYWVFRVIS